MQAVARSVLLGNWLLFRWCLPGHLWQQHVLLASRGFLYRRRFRRKLVLWRPHMQCRNNAMWEVNEAKQQLSNELRRTLPMLINVQMLLQCHVLVLKLPSMWFLIIKYFTCGRGRLYLAKPYSAKPYSAIQESAKPYSDKPNLGVC